MLFFFLVAYRLSGYGGINVGLPPASPSEGDLMITVSTNSNMMVASFPKDLMQLL